MNVNIEDIIQELRNSVDDSENADIAEASIELVTAAAKVLQLYKDYYSKGNRKYKYNGESKTLTEWSKELGIPYPTLRKRIMTNGWGVEEALSTPVQNSAIHRNFKKTVTVMQYNCKRELIREFPSIREAARQLSMDYQLVNKAIEGMDPLEQVGQFGYYLATPKQNAEVVEEKKGA